MVVALHPLTRGARSQFSGAFAPREGFIMSLEQEFLVGFLLGHNAGSHREIDQLLETNRAARGADALSLSGTAAKLTVDETAALSHPMWSCCCVAASLKTGRIIGYVSAHKVVTRARGAEAVMEEVVVSPFEYGKGVGKAVMVALLNHVRETWKIRKAVLTSDPSRETARALYTKLGFQQIGDRHFVLTFPDSELWMPAACSRPRHSSGVGRSDGGAFWHMTRDMQVAVARICSGHETAAWSSAPWTIIVPVGIYLYKDVP